MGFFRIFSISLFSLSLILPSFTYIAHSLDREDLRQEIKELRSMMEKMQMRLDQLEEKNRVLEEQAKQRDKDKEELVEDGEFEASVMESEPKSQSFLKHLIRDCEWLK